MGRTTNILDLNNRLEKVEKENKAQNNYNSLKNRPKINGNLLTGDKTGTQLGLAEAQDIGDLSTLTTTDKSSCVGAINEVNYGLTNIGSKTDLGNVQGSGTITLSDAVSNYRFVQILIGYYKSGYPCFGQALLPVSTLFIDSDDIPVTVPFTDRTGTNSGKADISFLSATSAKVVNTNATAYTRVIGIA